MSCTTCKGRCAAPESCHVPLVEARPKRAKTFLPTFGLTGPFRRRRRLHPPLGLLAVLVKLLLALAALLAIAFLFFYHH